MNVALGLVFGSFVIVALFWGWCEILGAFWGCCVYDGWNRVERILYVE